MTFPKPEFAAQAIKDAQAAAVAAYPNESCGFICNGAYIPATNSAADPTKDFRIDPTQVATALTKGLQAIIHSHPDGPAIPSANDMQGQIDTACIWGIIVVTTDKSLQPPAPVASEPVWWGDYRLEEPLIGRSFVHGISDCGSIIRGYFWQVKKIKIDDFPRDYEWWKNGDNFYVEKFASAGFKEIQAADVQDGDIFIGKVLSKVPNHGGVVLSVTKGLGLHHLEKRLSRREPILPWQKFITHYLRYTGDKVPDTSGLKETSPVGESNG